MGKEGKGEWGKHGGEGGKGGRGRGGRGGRGEKRVVWLGGEAYKLFIAVSGTYSIQVGHSLNPSPKVPIQRLGNGNEARLVTEWCLIIHSVASCDCSRLLLSRCEPIHWS